MVGTYVTNDYLLLTCGLFDHVLYSPSAARSVYEAYFEKESVCYFWSRLYSLCRLYATVFRMRLARGKRVGSPLD